MGSCETGTFQVYISKRTLSFLNQNDNRWARIGNGMKVSSEITEFNSRIADAKELFKVVSDWSLYDLTEHIRPFDSRTSQS